MEKRTSGSESQRLELEQRSTYRFAILNAMTTRALVGSFVRKFGLNFAAWRTLTVIGRFGPIFPGGVGKRMSLGSDRVARAVDELVKKGLVARTPDETDRRRMLLSLTARGRRVYVSVDKERRAAEKKFLSVLTPEELKVFHVCMDKLENQARKLYASKSQLE